MKKLLLLFYFSSLLIGKNALAQFTNLSANLENVDSGTLEWGDFDSDGDQDLLLTGDRINYPYDFYTRLYKNNSGSFSGISSSLTSVGNSDACWGDYDNDGDLDLALNGITNSGSKITKIFKNNSGSFSDINANLLGMQGGNLEWGDFDNDGDLDLLMSGTYTKIYKNNEGIFTILNINFEGLGGDAKWGDYDGDGDLDIIVCGLINGNSGNIASILFRNDDGNFTEIVSGIIDLSGGSFDWGDYDSDGDMDILLAGWDSSGNKTRIYQNTAGGFVNIGAAISSYQGPAYWGDFDNDGDLDAFFCYSGRIINNENGLFNNTLYNFNTWFETATIGDYDGDGDLDIATQGATPPRIWRNDITQANSPPATPSGLIATPNGNSVALEWNKSTDAQTQQNALQYNIVISTTPNGTDILGPMANITTGKRLVSRIGNSNLSNSRSIDHLPQGAYYWRVQTIDNCYSGSPFSVEDSFSITVPSQPLLVFPPNDTVNMDTVIAFRWEPVSSASNYWFQLATDDLFSNFIFNDSTNIDTSFNAGGLSINTKYFWRVRAQNINGWSSWTEIFQFRTYYPYAFINAGLAGVYDGEIEWGDYDMDNDLDLFVVGRMSDYPTYTITSTLYNNNGGLFSVVNDGALSLWGAAVEWADYDNDGDLDYAITGASNPNPFNPLTLVGDIYTNNNGIFSVLWNSPVNNVYDGSLDWGDYDNDGDLDLLLSGATNSYPDYLPITRLIRKDSASFVSLDIGLPGIRKGEAKWGDYNNDGKLDIVLSGINTSGTAITTLYENQSDTFIYIPTGMDGISEGSVEWGDYDVDGDLDLLLVGSRQTGPVAKVYQNTNGVFNALNDTLLEVSAANGSWGDYDNDGDLDILISGQKAYIAPDYIYDAKIFIYNNGAFSELLSCGITGVGSGYSSWGDYDNDGDLDLAVCGTAEQNQNTGVEGVTTTVYRRISGNNTYGINSIPLTPTGMVSSSTNFSATFSWNNGNDSQTLQNALTYNLSVANDPWSVDVLSSAAKITTGFMRTPRRGNMQSSNSWTLRDLRPGRYFWKVQAVDQCYAGSNFTALDSIMVFDPNAPTLIYPFEDQDSIRVNETMQWAAFSNAVSYHLQIAFDSLFTNLFLDDSLLIDTTFPVNNFILNRNYYWRVKAKLGTGYSYWSYYRHFFTRHNPSPVTTSIQNCYMGELAWGDYDNDGDLDLAITGISQNGICIIYRNDGNDNFTDIGATVPGFYNGSTDWADFDNDNDLDLLLTGTSNSSPKVSLYRNDNGTFVEHNAGFTGATNSDADWGDYDNDGDLDVLITGDPTNTQGMLVAKLYNNNNGFFTVVNTGITPVFDGEIEWGDYDKDGDLDLSLIGKNSPNFTTVPYAQIFRNDGNNVFTDINAGLEPMIRGATRWGDYDNDGDLDLLQMGQDYQSSDYKGRLYRNDSNTFVEITSNLPASVFSDAKWGDYENDGDLDILFSGSAYSPTKSTIFLNDNGIFTDMNPGFEGLEYSSVSWGDYDNDGDLDMIMCGKNDNTPNGKTILYKSNARQNTKPSVPSGLNTNIQGNKFILSWDPSTDYETPSISLSYNIRVGTTPGSNDICSSMTDDSSGFRRIVRIGNTGLKQGWMIDSLQAGSTYFWSVQAVDHTNECSAMSEDDTLIYTTNINFNPQTICDGSQYSFNGNVYTVAGNYFDTLTTVFGTDSVIVTQLSVNPAFYTPVSAAICLSDSIFLQGSYQTTAGTYYDTLLTVNGCDSIIASTLSVLSNTDSAVNISACGNFSLNSQVYDSSGTYFQVLSNTSGCDSTITLNLIINQSTGSSQQSAICAGDSIFLQGNYQTTAGTYYDTLSSVNGCDSIITTTLFVNPQPTVAVTSSNISCTGICDGTAAASLPGGCTPQTYSWSNGVSSPVNTNLCSGKFYVTATQCDGCTVVDSVEIFDPAEISLLLTSTSDSGTTTGTATVIASGGTSPYTYIWSNGATQPAINNLQSATYFVTVTDANGCIETDSVFVSTTVGIQSQFSNLKTQIFVYPNPNDGTFTIQIVNPDFQSGAGAELQTLPTGRQVRNFELRIYNVLGEEVYKTSIILAQNTIHLNLPGVYSLQLISENGIETRRVIVE